MAAIKNLIGEIERDEKLIAAEKELEEVRILLSDALYKLSNGDNDFDYVREHIFEALAKIE